jgi:hypothetical protein
MVLPGLRLLIISLLLALISFASSSCQIHKTLLTFDREPSSILKNTPRPLHPFSILVQLDYETGGMTEIQGQYTFGHAAPFTMYAGGHVIYLGGDQDQRQFLHALIPVEDVLEFRDQILNLGYERLLDTGNCRYDWLNRSTCIIDGARSILRVRRPDGFLDEVRLYPDLSDYPQVYESILALIKDFSHPSATPYLPDKASLLIFNASGTPQFPLSEFPLDPGILVLPEGSCPFTVVILDSTQVRDYLAEVPTNVGRDYFYYNNRVFYSIFVPWLPGANFITSIEQHMCSIEINLNTCPCKPTPTPIHTSS